MERQFFAAVPDEEWLSCGWMKNNRAVYPTLYQSICHFNRVSHWATSYVLRAAEGKERSEGECLLLSLSSPPTFV